MSASIIGKLDWSLSSDEEQHRNYSLTLLAETTNTADGPYTVMNASGMPIIGSSWIYGNDNDYWAMCHPQISVTPIHQKGDPHYFWEVGLTFSTKPINQCCDQQPGNPLSEPQKVSGSFVQFVKKTDKDRNGNQIKNSSLEPIKIDKEEARPRVSIEQNVAALQLTNLCQMINTLNDSTLWGLGSRRIRLSSITWERLVYGRCNFYYRRRFDFDIKFDTFDLYDVADMGFKRLKGHYDDTGAWVTDGGLNLNNPDHFIRIKDINGENLPQMMLNAGNVNTDPSANPKYLPFTNGAYTGTGIQLMGESNFLALGIPVSF